ncbi:MAG: ferric reductase-like transmembrane domain-containing protein [Oscillospiraceae bacterium]|jgi:DMSO/TMAO reductase YedYZ heme-binding membrane subunit|nr:ferric reductase-like transmembrane domain-containing protein [Oscillospiraceae bacterium]
MLFIISLCIVALLLPPLRDSIKKHRNVYYAAAVGLSAFTVLVTFNSTFRTAPAWVRTYILGLFDRGALSAALFTAVMVLGALPNGSALLRKYMPIRAELSILASILIFGHNIAQGRTYFRFLVTNPGRLSVTQLTATIFTVVMLAMLLPLFVTSFPAVRRKFKGKTWKKLQRMAYPFYMMIYGHVLLLNIPLVISTGKVTYVINLIVYSAVFLGYAAARVRKAVKRKNAARA